MRAVIDTNVLLSGLLWRGTPHRLIEAVRGGTNTLITSPALLAELGEVICRPKFQAILVRSRADPEWMPGELRRLAEIVEPPSLPAQVGRDPDDDALLALVLASTRTSSSPVTPTSSRSGPMPVFRSSIARLRSPG